MIDPLDTPGKPAVAAEDEATTPSAETFFQWSDDWLLGVEAIDDDHRELAAMVTRLVELLLSEPESGQLVLSPANAERARQLFVQLYDSMLRHFQREEQMMSEAGYADLQAHTQEHQMLLAELKYYAQQMVASDRSLDLRSLLALRRWFVIHIMESDRCLADYLLQARHTATAEEP